jgi:hypothetical protein
MATPGTPNLGAAKMAVKYVQSKMDIGASNKIGIGMIAKAMCAGGTFNNGEVRNKVDQDLAKISNPTWGNVLDLSADWAKHYGCGNCGEQSALAFVYLRQLGIHPLDWMQIGNFKHAFVIIGRNGDSDPSDFNTWSQLAAVCDPWAGRAEPKLYIGVWNWKPELLYREE